MSVFTPVSRLSWRQLVFPFSLVLFEFTTYIAHDMVQPGMLLVTGEFGVGPEWVSASLTAYLMGGILLQWLLGPLSDKTGRRPVLLAGVALFALACGLTHWAATIEQFVGLRFVQGISLCFIGAVGYAAIQEAFDETRSVRIMALMANVALLAPLVGPLAGAALLSVTSWRTMFWVFAALSVISFIGLWRAMPETAGDRQVSIRISSLARGYWRLLGDRQVLSGSLAIGLAAVPVLAWVALAPVILIHDQGMSRMDYALLQLPVFLAMIGGNLTLSYLAGRVTIEQPLRFGAWPLCFGLLLVPLGLLTGSHQVLWLVTGLSIYAFGSGMVNAGLYRLTLFSSSEGKGLVAALLGMLSILVFAVGIELAKFVWFNASMMGFSLVNLASGALWLVLVVGFLREYARRSRVTPL
ncbi:multidrug transporter MdfA [Salmonella enterica subsp. enterica serovar Choleraesuis]|nr:multidrug transporter MdfA [Salmonella enterica subsp. enterica serovar Choleraesuis]